MPRDPSPSTAAHQFRIRDLLAVTLLLSLILAGGRAAGGAVSAGEAMLLVASVVSIVTATIFVGQRWVWFGLLAASGVATALLTRAPGGWPFALGAVVIAHGLFAAMPILVIGPHQLRWLWITAAVACQVAAATWTPADAVRMVAAAAPLAWLLALAVILCRYRSLVHSRPRSPVVEPPKEMSELDSPGKWRHNR
jgi:hypothetical protein